MTASLLIAGLLLATGKPVLAFELREIERDTGSFVLGFLTGYAAHELGHLVIADSLGYDSEFDGVTIVYPDSGLQGKDLVRIASAGFQAQWIASEIALRYRDDRPLDIAADNYSAGIVAAHLAISMAYVSVLMNHEDGDTEGLSKGTGISTRDLALTLAIPAVLDGWRLFGNQTPDWVPAISAGSKALGLTWIWTFEQ